MSNKDQKLELVRGSGNVFKDHGDPDADVQQMKAILAARIIGILDAESLSVRDAQRKTGYAAADFSRIRNSDLGRFSVDRLVRIINKLDEKTEVSIKLTRRNTEGRANVRL